MNTTKTIENGPPVDKECTCRASLQEKRECPNGCGITICDCFDHVCPNMECGCLIDGDDRCEECCDHDDVERDERCCLICGADRTEYFMGEAEWRADMAEDR